MFVPSKIIKEKLNSSYPHKAEKNAEDFKVKVNKDENKKVIIAPSNVLTGPEAKNLFKF